MKRKITKITTFILLLSFTTSAISQCLVINNIKGYTPVANKPSLEQFNWLAFESGKVIGRSDTLPTIPSSCQQIDGQGKTLLPGLIDAHGHIAGLGQEMSRANLRGTQSEQQAVERVVEFARHNTKSAWILGRGWNQVLWSERQFPNKRSLDKTGIKRPILLTRVDGHAAWANSQALKLAGINHQTPDPEGGKIVRDKNGKPTGVLIDNAIGLVVNKIPAPSKIEREYAFDKAFAHLLSLGIVSVHDAGINQADIDSYQERSHKHQLPIRIYGMLSGADRHLKQWLNQGIIKDDNDFLSIRSVKLYADGALGSRGAALLAPYSDDKDNKGLLVTQPDELQNLVNLILSKGFQVNIHAIGDRGNRLVLDTFETAFKQVGGKALRNRIEHAQVVSLKDIPRFKTLDIIASMQPVHATSDKNMAGDRLGIARLKGAYAWQKFIQQGTIIAAGSDFPVELANPFHGLHAAITRKDHSNQPEGGWLPYDKMTRYQAIKSFTLNAAYAAHQENTLGSLEAGKWADFILIDQNILKVSADQIWQTRVLQTWVGGQLKYQAKPTNAN
ncbi:amidohydrolase [Aliikangiella maris]|uniref:Amidohydrolase n=2 Tax=Aliikangiella maris TaxID=3162458 RepID=A0ABV3MP89_9GAMM